MFDCIFRTFFRDCDRNTSQPRHLLKAVCLLNIAHLIWDCDHVWCINIYCLPNNLHCTRRCQRGARWRRRRWVRWYFGEYVGARDLLVLCHKQELLQKNVQPLPHMGNAPCPNWRMVFNKKVSRLNCISMAIPEK